MRGANRNVCGNFGLSLFWLNILLLHLFWNYLAVLFLSKPTFPAFSFWSFFYLSTFHSPFSNVFGILTFSLAIVMALTSLFYYFSLLLTFHSSFSTTLNMLAFSLVVSMTLASFFWCVSMTSSFPFTAYFTAVVWSVRSSLPMVISSGIRSSVLSFRVSWFIRAPWMFGFPFGSSSLISMRLMPLSHLPLWWSSWFSLWGLRKGWSLSSLIHHLFRRFGSNRPPPSWINHQFICWVLFSSARIFLDIPLYSSFLWV